jgi:hypothetical protein
MTLSAIVLPWLEAAGMAWIALYCAYSTVEHCLWQRGVRQHERNNQALREAQLRLRQLAEE